MLDQQKTKIDHVRTVPYHPINTFGRALMPAIHEIATLTSKGQPTLPKSVRQLLGVDTGVKKLHSTYAPGTSWSAA